MGNDETQPRRGGRLRKSPVGEHRKTFTFRLGGVAKDGLIDAASKSGRSLSEEIEHRIEASIRGDKRAAFEDIILRGGKNSGIIRHIASIMTMFDITDGKEDYEAERVFFEKAIEEILKNTLPDPQPRLAPSLVSPERSARLDRARRRGTEIGQFVIRETFLDILEEEAANRGEDASWLRRRQSSEKTEPNPENGSTAEKD